MNRSIVLGLLIFFGSILNAAPSGDGSSGSPWLINTLEDLKYIADNSDTWDDYFLQTADIDAAECSTWYEGAGWLPIGRVVGETEIKFRGFYDGQGFTISNLYINRPNMNNVGLFGHVGSDTYASTIENLGLTYPEVYGGRGTGTLIGRVTGYSGTLTQNCFSMYGKVVGDGATGGLIGSHNSYITNPSNRDHHPRLMYCFAHNDVSWSRKAGSGADKLGGLTGCNQKGIIINSYARSSVTVDNDPAVTVDNPQDHSTVPTRIGGLAGCILIRGYAEKSFSTGSVTTYGDVGDVGGFVGSGGTGDSDGEATGCFWDTQTSGQATSSPTLGCTGKTTSEMKTKSTFTGAAWDFTDETTNGSNDYWSISATVNDGYPYLTNNAVPDIPLPICLSCFKAEYMGGAVILNWQTASETENALFLVYRDGKYIASIAGAGNSTEPQNYTISDPFVIPERTYTYMLADVSFANEETEHENMAVTLTIPESGTALDYQIGSAYPNPFNPTTLIPLHLAKEAVVRATLYDIAGRPLRELQNGSLSAGSHELKIDGANLSTGIYFVRINVGAYRNTPQVQKIALMK